MIIATQQVRRSSLELKVLTSELTRLILSFNMTEFGMNS
jgi:hypothetical protein